MILNWLGVRFRCPRSFCGATRRWRKRSKHRGSIAGPFLRGSITNTECSRSERTILIDYGVIEFRVVKTKKITKPFPLCNRFFTVGRRRAQTRRPPRETDDDRRGPVGRHGDLQDARRIDYSHDRLQTTGQRVGILTGACVSQSIYVLSSAHGYIADRSRNSEFLRSFYDGR